MLRRPVAESDAMVLEWAGSPAEVNPSATGLWKWAMAFHARLRRAIVIVLLTSPPATALLLALRFALNNSR